ncbi:DUF692 domain-containing protein [Sandarakinorhabdus rubra]|uniref:DUF692 domain-containing protein n=1 Tax=Sandarakinorhabdus rubra TaxID=2672568 RepID=UPI001F429376|nr:DUF692 domain-containing protein [Sandarakinorhabdus rubra]
MRAGIGLRLPHLAAVAAGEAALPPGLWLEVHAENFMVDGGPRLTALLDVAERFPVSLHGVGLALAGTRMAPRGHLRRLGQLCDRVQPVLVSDHLAWQRAGDWHVPDFLPFARTRRALAIAITNVGRAQDALGRRLLVENPSHYADVGGHTFAEADFLAELAAATGCGLLVDVNNIHVSAHNLGLDAGWLVDQLPAAAVAEIHVAGHRPDPASPLLIDSHDAPVAEPVWALAARLLARTGPVPLLVERDAELPPLAELVAEAARGAALLAEVADAP